jgi:hypothetical protein
MSLPSTMTIAGDTYNFYEVVDGVKAVYHGPDHTDTNRQTLEFIRTEPKRSGVDFGVRRGFIRLTEDTTVVNSDASSKKAQIVTNASINWPVGYTSTTLDLIKLQLMRVWGVLSGNVYQDPTSAWATGTLPSIVQFFETGAL